MKRITNSMTMQGGVITTIGFIIDFFSINITGSEIEQFIKAIFVLVGLIMVFIGRWRKGDLYIKYL